MNLNDLREKVAQIRAHISFNIKIGEYYPPGDVEDLLAYIDALEAALQARFRAEGSWLQELENVAKELLETVTRQRENYASGNEERKHVK